MEPSSPSNGSIRNRVCKACDRCRLKKSKECNNPPVPEQITDQSKCNGYSPCSRCKADNAICVFGQRKKSHERLYSKGYVEMLENQQAQLVLGLQKLYKRMQNGQGWQGAPLEETSFGMPLTHDILERLGVLEQECHLVEDVNAFDPILITDTAATTDRQQLQDGHRGADYAPSSAYEHLPQKMISSNSCSINHTARDLPDQAPFYPQSARSTLECHAQTTSTGPVQRNLAPATVASNMNAEVDSFNQYTAFMMNNSLELISSEVPSLQEQWIQPTSTSFSR